MQKFIYIEQTDAPTANNIPEGEYDVAYVFVGSQQTTKIFRVTKNLPLAKDKTTIEHFELRSVENIDTLKRMLDNKRSEDSAGKSIITGTILNDEQVKAIDEVAIRVSLHATGSVASNKKSHDKADPERKVSEDNKDDSTEVRLRKALNNYLKDTTKPMIKQKAVKALLKHLEYSQNRGVEVSLTLKNKSGDEDISDLSVFYSTLRNGSLGKSLRAIVSKGNNASVHGSASLGKYLTQLNDSNKHFTKGNYCNYVNNKYIYYSRIGKKLEVTTVVREQALLDNEKLIGLLKSYLNENNRYYDSIKAKAVKALVDDLEYLLKNPVTASTPLNFSELNAKTLATYRKYFITGELGKILKQWAEDNLSNRFVKKDLQGNAQNVNLAKTVDELFIHAGATEDIITSNAANASRWYCSSLKCVGLGIFSFTKDKTSTLNTPLLNVVESSDSEQDRRAPSPFF